MELTTVDMYDELGDVLLKRSRDKGLRGFDRRSLYPTAATSRTDKTALSIYPPADLTKTPIPDGPEAVPLNDTKEAVPNSTIGLGLMGGWRGRRRPTCR